MSQTLSPSRARCYGLARVARVWTVLGGMKPLPHPTPKSTAPVPRRSLHPKACGLPSRLATADRACCRQLGAFWLGVAGKALAGGSPGVREGINQN